MSDPRYCGVGVTPERAATMRKYDLARRADEASHAYEPEDRARKWFMVIVLAHVAPPVFLFGVAVAVFSKMFARKYERELVAEAQQSVWARIPAKPTDPSRRWERSADKMRRDEADPNVVYTRGGRPMTLL